VVHYPLFRAVGPAQWPAYERAHRRRITPVVAPPMLAQSLVAAALLVERPGPLTAVNLILAASLLLITLTVFGALHGRLQQQWSANGHRRLLLLNGLRTVAWTAQTAVAIALVARV
jgi:hypothetical protein